MEVAVYEMEDSRVRTVVIKSLLLALLICLFSARPALAYIDPNVGGQLFQILAVGFAALSGVALLFSRQIRAGLARAKRYVRERLTSEEEGETRDGEA